MKNIIFVVLCLIQINSSCGKREPEDCSVCEDVLKATLKAAADKTTDRDVIQKKLLKVCKDADRFCKKDNSQKECRNETLVSVKKHQARFCNLVGALENAPTMTYKENVVKPLSMYIPPERVCKKLHEKDDGVCSLKYDKPKEPVNWNKVLERIEKESKKMRIKEFKQILKDLGGSDKGFTEK